MSTPARVKSRVSTAICTWRLFFREVSMAPWSVSFVGAPAGGWTLGASWATREKATSRAGRIGRRVITTP